MPNSFSAIQSCHSSGDLLRADLLIRALPKGFSLRSSASRRLKVNPGLNPKQLREMVTGWTEVSRSGEDDAWALYKKAKAILTGYFYMGDVRLSVYSADDQADALIEKAMEPFEKHKFENKEEGGVWVNFSYVSGTGVERNTQFIRCPEWADIQGNYPMDCREEIARTMARKRPWADGRLMIWHGEPGTGKTFAIRSLLMAWRDRFNFVIVTDPEKLLASPSYYYEVASAPNMNSVPGQDSPDDDDDSESKKKRLVFIIEDAADLISTKGRERHWDKFGKLLNITDGLIGQGREDIFLITFNEALEDIDSAIARPGRCLSKVEFGRFDLDGAAEWMRLNGCQLPKSGLDTWSLAELYRFKAKSKKDSPVTVS